MSVTRISPEQVAERLESEPETTYIDVRSTREFAGGHVPGAVNVPLAEHDDLGRMAPNPRFMEAMSAAFETDSALILGCAAGGRSMRAAQTLMDAGYTNVVDMIGGFSGKRVPPEPGWVAGGHPVAQDGKTWSAVLDELG